jgi:dipeptidase D
MPKIAAIHAGLECSVFASRIKGLDCIAVGPDMTGVHTPKETLSVSSTKDIYEILLNVLRKSK